MGLEETFLFIKMIGNTFLWSMLYVSVERKIDNKVIQVEGKIYWETKSTLNRFGFNKPSSGLWWMILEMLNQLWMFKNTNYKETREICIPRKSWLFD